MSVLMSTEEMCHLANIAYHYTHAKKKHPYFCDIIKSDDLQFDFAEWQLEDCRKRLVHAREANVVRWDELLDCEKYEAMVEIKHGDTAHAVEELYDCIAVCLRTIDVLEGRQKLGKPETKGTPFPAIPPGSKQQRRTTMPEYKKYIRCHIVEATPMTRGCYNELRGWEIPANENPDDEGYHVVYPDGYQSWCPKAQFEAAGRPVDGMTFGQATKYVPCRSCKVNGELARLAWEAPRRNRYRR